MKAIKYHLSKMASCHEKQQYENKHEPNQQRIFHVRTKDQDDILQESNNIILQKATTPPLMIEDFTGYEVDRISNKAMEILSLQSNLSGSKRAKSHDQDSIINALLFEINQSKVNEMICLSHIWTIFCLKMKKVLAMRKTFSKASIYHF